MTYYAGLISYFGWQCWCYAGTYDQNDTDGHSDDTVVTAEVSQPMHGHMSSAA